MIRYRPLLLWLAIWSLPGAASEWQMDAGASRLEFVVTYEGQASPGVFKTFDARLTFDPNQPANGRLQVSVLTTSADMGSAELYEGMRSPEWFDMARYPTAEFASRDIRPRGERHYDAHGVLRIKDVAQKVTVPFVWQQTGNQAALSGELLLDRSVFHVGTGEWAVPEPIGLAVRVKFNVTLQRRN